MKAFQDHKVQMSNGSGLFPLTRRYFRKFIMSGFLTLLKVTSEWLSAFGGLIIMVKEVGLLTTS